MLNVKIISDYQSFAAMKEAWNELVADSWKNYVFFTHEWYDCWWQAFGKNNQLFILAAEDTDCPGKLLAIAPFMTCKTTLRGLPVQTIQFMANDDSPRCDLIVRKKITDAEQLCESILDAIRSSKIKWDLLFLENIEKDSPYLQAFMKVFDRKGLKHTSQPKISSPWLPIGQNWDAYYGSLSRRLKMTVNNVRNRLQKLGDVVIEELDDADQLTEMSAISKNAWKYLEGKSFLNREDRRNFFILLSQAARAQGWLSLWMLRINGKPVAYEYHLRYDGKEVALLAEFDQEYYKNSPGTFLDFYIIKKLHEIEVTEYDLGGSLDQYKTKWKPNLRNTEDYYVYNSILLYIVERWFVSALRSIRQKVSSLFDKK